MFVLGCPCLLVAVDHKPLVKIFNDRQLDTIKKPWLLSLKEKTLMFKFDITSVEGARNCAPDATSRHPVHADASNEDIENGTLAYMVRHAGGMRSITWDRINIAAACDKECVSLKQLIQARFADTRNEVPEGLRHY